MKDLPEIVAVPVCLVAASCAGPGSSSETGQTGEVERSQPAMNIADSRADMRLFALPQGVSKEPDSSALETPSPSTQPARSLRIADPNEFSIPNVADK